MSKGFLPQDWDFLQILPPSFQFKFSSAQKSQIQQKFETEMRIPLEHTNEYDINNNQALIIENPIAETPKQPQSVGF